MEHRDAYLSDVTIVTRGGTREQLEQIAADLVQSGLSVDELNHEQCVIEGTIDASKVDAIRTHSEVSYVRVEISYIVDYPTGDPRDLDGNATD